SRPERAAVLAHELLLLNVHRLTGAKCGIGLAADALVLFVAWLNDARQLAHQLAGRVAEHAFEGRARHREPPLRQCRNAMRRSTEDPLLALERLAQRLRRR